MVQISEDLPKCWVNNGPGQRHILWKVFFLFYKTFLFIYITISTTAQIDLFTCPGLAPPSVSKLLVTSVG